LHSKAYIVWQKFVHYVKNIPVWGAATPTESVPQSLTLSEKDADNPIFNGPPLLMAKE